MEEHWPSRPVPDFALTVLCPGYCPAGGQLSTMLPIFLPRDWSAVRARCHAMIFDIKAAQTRTPTVLDAPCVSGHLQCARAGHRDFSVERSLRLLVN
jgi:hypothetical protein